MLFTQRILTLEFLRYQYSSAKYNYTANYTSDTPSIHHRYQNSDAKIAPKDEEDVNENISLVIVNEVVQEEIVQEEIVHDEDVVLDDQTG